MKQHSKKILIYIFLFSAIALSLFYFFLSLQKRQMSEKINLFGLLLPESESILVLNQPEYLNELLKNDTARLLLSETVPGKVLTLIKEIPENNIKILSFHGGEVLIYSHADRKKTEQLKLTLFTALSPYPAQEEIISGKIKAYFYALPGKRFFGYYTRNGVFVAGFSRKLLEKVALRQILLEKSKVVISSAWLTASRKLNRNVPLNLLFSTAPLRLSLCIDSTERSLSDFTLAADLYYKKDRLCCFGSVPLIQLEDSLYFQLAEKISSQVERLYPRLKIKTFLEVENNQLFYSVCGTSSVSTTNPSNE